MQRQSAILQRLALLAFFVYLFIFSAIELQPVAWGTGSWWGQYSLKWGMAYIAYIIICALTALLIGLVLFRRERFQPLLTRIVTFREKWVGIRWGLALLTLIIPAWFLQYTPWGVVFHGIHTRVLFWSIAVVVLSFAITRGVSFFSWSEILAAVLVTSGVFVVAASFADVTDYPFSLGWSEGNRMWDYSIMFGRGLYNYPLDKKIPVFLDVGRQFIGGLPFIFPGVTISIERFWVGVTVILPYLLLGFAAFRFLRKMDVRLWMLAAFWALIFLKQGPIHPPLVLCAVVVALLWRKPLWLAIPLIAITGYAAEVSRYTWLFAPGMWIGMLELAGAKLQDEKISRVSWGRAVSLGLAGMAGGYFGQKIVGFFAGNANATVAVTVSNVSTAVVKQPLLWYRLLPNATYGAGILAGLLIATLPLIVVLFYLVVSGKWKLNTWQALAVLSPLLAFLVVGLVISAKIGGGGDLHNMDMFLIGLLFATVIAWEKAGSDWLAKIAFLPIGLRLLLILLVALPGFQSLKDMRSYHFAEDIDWLATLTDAPFGDDLGMYPSKEVANEALAALRQEVALVRSQGEEILFMDQRQLLTFGFVENVPLVPQYEKKVLMNEALSSNVRYFKTYYADLAEQRFALIISEPLRKPVKDSSYQFGEENNAWVQWVSIPTLCYYEPKITLKEVGVQLLIPRTDTSDCASLLPEGAVP